MWPDFSLFGRHTLPSLCLPAVKKPSVSTRVGLMQGNVVVSRTSAVKCLEFHPITMFQRSVLWLAGCSKPASAYARRLLFHSLAFFYRADGRFAEWVQPKFLLSFSRKTLICAQRCEKTTLTAIYFHHRLGANYSAPSRRMNRRIHLGATVTSRHLCSSTSKTVVPTCSHFVFVVLPFPLARKRYIVFYRAASPLCDSANGTTLTLWMNWFIVVPQEKNNFRLPFLFVSNIY